MAFGLDDLAAIVAPQLLGGLFGGSSGPSSTEKEAVAISRENLELLKSLLEPQIAAQARTRAGLQPTLDQMIPYLAYASGVAPGTQIKLPGSYAENVPEWLRPYANAPEGSWENELYRRTMYYGPDVAQKRFNDIVSDIRGGENPWQRLNREGGANLGGAQGLQEWLSGDKSGNRLAAPPDDYIAPLGMTPDSVLTVPTAENIPDWLKPVTVSPELEEALQYYEKPYTESEMTQLTEPMIGGVNRYVQDARSAVTGDLARRGMIGPGVTSTPGNMMSPGLMALYAQMKAPLTAQGITMRRDQETKSNAQRVGNLSSLMGLKNTASQAQLGNIGNLMALIQGGTPTADPSGVSNAYGNLANLYMGVAGNQNALNAANAAAMGDIGSVIGQLIAQRRSNAKNTQTGGGTTDGTTGSVYWDPASGTWKSY